MHTPGRTPLNERSARRQVWYLHYTQQTQKMKIHAFCGIRVHVSSSCQEASDLRRSAVVTGINNY